MTPKEIDFKCWDVEDKIMYDIAFPTWNGMIEVWKNNIPQGETICLTQNGEVEEGHLLQWIGRYSTNNKKIYTGDLVLYKYRLGVIYYDEYCLQFRIKYADDDTDYLDKDFSIIYVGNIYQIKDTIDKLTSLIDNNKEN